MCDNGKITLTQAGLLMEVLRAPQGDAKVGRAMPDGNVIYGTARSIGTETGMMDFTSDARDQYLRVTSTMGFEYFWKVSDLMEAAADTTFVVGIE